MVDRETGMALLLKFDNQQSFFATNLSDFIFDFNRLYVISVRLQKRSDELYSSGFGRGNFKLPEHERLKIRRIRFESPGLIEFIAAAGTCAAALLAVVQLMKELDLWPLEKQKLQLEVEEKREQLARLQNPPVHMGQYLAQHERHPQVYSATGQLRSNPLKPTDIKIDIEV